MRYLYGIVGETWKWDLRGVGGGEVYAIESGPVAAVVSDLEDERLRPERRHLMAHHDVISKLGTRTTVLPARFGTVADDTDEVRRTLQENRASFARELKRLSGKVEMGLRLSWAVENIFEYFVGKHPELRAARDRTFGAGAPDRDDKIELGRLFEKLLAEEREAHASKVESSLSCAEVLRIAPRSELEIARFACLIPRETEKKFGDAVRRVARRFDQDFAFDFNGPWAPHSFVQIRVKE